MSAGGFAGIGGVLRAILRVARGFGFFVFTWAGLVEEACCGLGKMGAAKAGCDSVATHKASKPTTIIPARLIQIHLRDSSILPMTLLHGKFLSVHRRGVYPQSRPAWASQTPRRRSGEVRVC